jgi:glycosyltransferase involved in cell wall biosynthesis
MKICFFGDSESIHIQRWCHYFKDLGHEVSLISFKNHQIEGVNCYFVNSGQIEEKGGNWKVLLNFKKVRIIVKDLKPDIFHAMYATSYGITGALVGFKPYVITSLGSDVLISPKNSKVYRFLLKFAFRKATWITAMAEHMKLEILNMGIPENKVSTVPFGINPAVFHEQGIEKSSTKLTIISTRNFELIYNIPHLLKALALVKDKIPNFELILIGAGSLREELTELTKSLKIENNCTFLGKLSQPEIADKLNRSHIFVSVSLSDGNNISLNEAMACGTFCIASSIPANEQWIQNSENGFLVDIDDVEDLAQKIIYSWENYQELQAKSLPLNRKMIQDKAIWETNMQRVEAKYKELVGK